MFRLSGLHEQSAGFYRTLIKLSANDIDKSYYLFLEGAGSVVDVYVNKRNVGRHRGAFTAAAFALTPALKPDTDNELIIRVTNRDNESINCLSQSNLFYTNGGLYRPVKLIKTSTVHIFPDMGSTGVYLTPKNISRKSADLDITTYLHNSGDKAAEVLLRHTILGPDGKKVAQAETSAAIPTGETHAATVTQAIQNPELWAPGSPNLYSVRTDVLINGRVVDSLIERTGIRTIAMKDGNFSLNGEKLLVRGVCKHHQDEHVWNAMIDEQLIWEMNKMIELGCNGIRLAHYPHRRLEYRLADEAGMVVWAENGLAGQKWDNQSYKGRAPRENKPTADGERITREMVRQNWNHPSIVFWSSGNETYDQVASRYADVIREEDKTRLITYASAGEKPQNVDFVAGNTYQGWYGSGHYSQFKELPGNAFISETGAGSWITHHIPYDFISINARPWKVDSFEPEEYCELFAEFRFQTIFRNNPDGHKMFLWWNFREFYNLKFKNNRNTKGILTLAGMPKDYYYLFQAFLRPDFPVLHLCGRHHFYRQFDPENGIKVYSNAKSVELFVNGTSQGKHNNGGYRQPDTAPQNQRQATPASPIKGTFIDNVFFWSAPLAAGRNLIEARDDRGKAVSMVIYQKGEAPVGNDGIVGNLKSSNPNNPAIFIDRPIEAQGPFYSEVDGSSDNTFDKIPELVKGASWITTKRLSDKENETDLSFTLSKPASVYVMHATGSFPKHTLDKDDPEQMAAAKNLVAYLVKQGFSDTGISCIWRRHSMWLADSRIMGRKAKAGETIAIPGHTLDYVVLIK